MRPTSLCRSRANGSVRGSPRRTSAGSSTAIWNRCRRMSKNAAGAREARALLEVATRESDPDRVGDELDVVAEAMRTQSEVQALLLNPGVAVGRKVQALQVIA